MTKKKTPAKQAKGRRGDNLRLVGKATQFKKGQSGNPNGKADPMVKPSTHESKDP